MILEQSRYCGVQALRLVAALLVVVTHTMFYAHERLDSSFPVWRGGAVGVDIFFVISGFVMVVSSHKLLGEPGGWRKFATGRLVRIVPLYWIATTVKALTMVFLPGAVLHAVLQPSSLIASYLFLPTRNVDGRVEPLLGVGWTLTFEMFFYAVFALALLIRVSPLFLAGGVLVALAFLGMSRPQDYPAWAVYADPIILYFLFGMLIAHAALRPKVWKFAPGILAGLVIILLAMSTLNAVSFARNSPFRMLLVVALMLAVVMLEPVLGSRIPRPVLLGGDASYSLYLFHPMMAPVVPLLFARIGFDNGWVSMCVSIVGVLIAAVLIYRLLERPITNALKSKVGSRRQRHEGEAPGQGIVVSGQSRD